MIPRQKHSDSQDRDLYLKLFKICSIQSIYFPHVLWLWISFWNTYICLKIILVFRYWNIYKENAIQCIHLLFSFRVWTILSQVIWKKNIGTIELVPKFVGSEWNSFFLIRGWIDMQTCMCCDWLWVHFVLISIVIRVGVEYQHNVLVLIYLRATVLSLSQL